MRYKRKERKVIGDYRTISRFLWFPLRLEMEDSLIEETRWLEWASIRQKFLFYPTGLLGFKDLVWVNVCWAD